MTNRPRRPSEPASRSPTEQVRLAWHEVADALWLAKHLDPDRTGDPIADDPPAMRRAGPAPRSTVAPPTTDASAGSPTERIGMEPVGQRDQRPAPPPGPRHGDLATLVGGRSTPLVAAQTPRPHRPPPPGLADGNGLARALRPLRQLVDSRHAKLLDEPATAERAADDPAWLPVLRPARERRWDIVVVIDDYLTMTVWRETVAAFVTLLTRQGGFRDVLVRRLGTDAKDPDDLTLRGPGGGAAPIGTAELVSAIDRRLVLMVTDGAAPAWHSGAALSVLRGWGRKLPVAIVQLLPQQQWFRTGVRPQRLRLRSPSPGTANHRLRWRRQHDLPELYGADPASDPDAVPVPVLELEPRWLGRWAQLVARDQPRWTSLPAVLTHRWQPAELVEQPATAPPEPADAPAPPQRVRDFTSWATPVALTLATQLAAAPLNLPVMRALQRELLPESQPSHLSEVLSGGLLHPVVPPAELDAGDQVTFEFHPGVRVELLAVGRRTDVVRVLRLVDDFLGPQVPAVRGLRQVLADPEAAPSPPVTPETEPFRRVEQSVLQALSGRYLARSRRLLAALTHQGETSPASTTAKLTGAGTPGDDVAPTDDHSVTIGTPAVATVPAQPTTGGTGVSSPPTTAAAAGSGAPRQAPSLAPLIWGNVPPRNPNFTGRTELLSLLHERMRAGTTAVLPQALHGMGGVGKSQLAVEYVYRHQQHYDVIWWIPAERTAQVGAALVELAQRLKLPVGMEVNTAVPAVLEALRLGQPHANWLLIFDNAESPETIRGYFPAGGPGSIMVTSRNPQWAHTARPLEVDVFTREESKQLLRQRGPELSDQAADELAEALGDLPLAIEQAAAWRAESGMPAEEYLRLFEEKRVELMEASASVDYQLPVAAAWNVSLDRLVESNPSALRLLEVCSFFAPEPIARTLIGGARSADIHPELNDALRDPMRLNRAIREINRYALARIDHRTNSIQMHRLIQAVLVDRMSPSQQELIRHSAHLMLASSDRNDPTTPANWRTYAELYPHLMASQAFASTDPWVQQLVDNEARYLYWWGDHEAACDLSQRTYDARCARLGTDAPATLNIGRWLGFMLFVVGRFTEAAALNAQLLATHQRVITEDTEELLAAIGAVAADRRVAGDFAGALAIDEDVYARHVRAFTADDPATLNAAHNLAVSVRLMGDFARAQELDTDTWQRRVRLYGEDHSVTLESTRGLILNRRELGDYLTAQAQQQAIVDRLRQVLSPAHPQILRNLRTLSTAMRKAGEHQAALDVSEQVWREFSSRYGNEHPDSIVAALNYSIDLRQIGDLTPAAELGEQVHDRYQRRLGERHPHTIAAALNLAVTHRLRGNVSEARRLDEAGYAVLSEHLGVDHPLTLANALNLASDLYAQGDYSSAYELDRETADRLRRVLGDDHPTTLAALGNLAMDLVGLGRTGEAHQMHADVVARFQQVLGSEHPATRAAADLTLRANCDLDPMGL